MYRKYFGLMNYAFTSSLPAEDLYASAGQAEAEARLRHLLNLRGIGLITGEVGSGKTTLCRNYVEPVIMCCSLANYAILVTSKCHHST